MLLVVVVFAECLCHTCVISKSKLRLVKVSLECHIFLYHWVTKRIWNVCTFALSHFLLISLAQESVPEAAARAAPAAPAAPFNSDEVGEDEEVEAAEAEPAVVVAAPAEPAADPVAADAAVVDTLPVDVAPAPEAPEVAADLTVPAMANVPAAVDAGAADASIAPLAAEMDTTGGAADPATL